MTFCTKKLWIKLNSNDIKWKHYLCFYLQSLEFILPFSSTKTVLFPHFSAYIFRTQDSIICRTPNSDICRTPDSDICRTPDSDICRTPGLGHLSYPRLSHLSWHRLGHLSYPLRTPGTTKWPMHVRWIWQQKHVKKTNKWPMPTYILYVPGALQMTVFGYKGFWSRN